MTRDTMAKVLEIKRPLEARGKEASERCNERREGSHDQGVEMEWRPRYRSKLVNLKCQSRSRPYFQRKCA